MQVKEVMTAPVIAVSSTDTIRKGMELMREYDIRHLPVIQDNQIRGMLNEHDLSGIASTLSFFGMGREQYDAFLEQPIDNVLKQRYMIDSTRVVTQTEQLETAIQVMLENKLTALPVTSSKDGPLVGIVSYIDVLLSLELILNSSKKAD